MGREVGRKSRGECLDLGSINPGEVQLIGSLFLCL